MSQIREGLEENHFSFSLDNCTIASKNLCAIKIKYVKEFDQDNKEKELILINRVIGLTDLEDNSSGEAIFNILKDKLLLTENIKRNLVGYTHDNASSLS